jgi:predicted nucleic acid-binding protein
MKILLDTSVWVAALLSAHPHHRAAAAVLAQGKKVDVWMCAHSIAELYSVLTRTPFTPRIHPAEGAQMVESVLGRAGVVALTPRDYRETVRECARSGWGGGAVYDALHIRAARKGACERLYTFNLRQFRGMAAEDFRAKIVSPEHDGVS